MTARLLYVFLAGLWIGGSAAVLGIVGYSFPGVERAVESNDRLAERAGFRPGETARKKASALWVLVGELNRHYFAGWNRAQLALALAALLAVLTLRRRGAALLTGLAAAIVLFLTFVMAPDLTERGRALDFVPRDPPPPGEAEFFTLHRAYTWLEVAKVVILAAAAALVMRGPPRRSAEDVK